MIVVLLSPLTYEYMIRQTINTKNPIVPHIINLFFLIFFFIDSNNFWATVNSLSLFFYNYLYHPFCLYSLLVLHYSFSYSMPPHSISPHFRTSASSLPSTDLSHSTHSLSLSTVHCFALPTMPVDSDASPIPFCIFLTLP